MKYITFIFLFLVAFYISGCQQAEDPNPHQSIHTDDGFEHASFIEAGMDSSYLLRMTSAIDSGVYPNIHSVLIAKNGKLVFEKYFRGQDEILGNSIGVVSHHQDSLHDIRSVTKSIVSACVGLALAEGKIESVNQSVWDFFPEYKNLATGEKSKLTVKHLLTMTSGFEWNENIPYTDPTNSEIQMDQSPDPIQFVLSRKLVQPPGQSWNYNGGTTQLLAAIIKKSTGQEIDEYAEKNLFAPLGVSRHVWLKFSDSSLLKDVPLAAAGLRLRSRDLFKFGLLYMNKGLWNGKRILPEKWIEESLSSHIRLDPVSGQDGYGYQFWIFRDSVDHTPVTLAASVGNGDQRIFMDWDNDLLIVTTAGNYNQWMIKNNVAAVLKNFIYPSLTTVGKK